MRPTTTTIGAPIVQQRQTIATTTAVVVSIYSYIAFRFDCPIATALISCDNNVFCVFETKGWASKATTSKNDDDWGEESAGNTNKSNGKRISDWDDDEQPQNKFKRSNGKC